MMLHSAVVCPTLLAFFSVSLPIITTTYAFSIGFDKKNTERCIDDVTSVSTSRSDFLSRCVSTIFVSTIGVSSSILLNGNVALAATDKVTSSSTKMILLNDKKHDFSMLIPSTWIQSTQTLADRRELVLYTDPDDTKTALFIAYTPIRDDYTSLNSFGTVDQVAVQTILPKSSLAGGVEVDAQMLSSISTKQAYIFDYIQSIPDIQPTTHFRTIFALVPGATGGAGSVLVTITAQTSEERYKSEKVKAMFDTIIDSYGKYQA